MRRRKGTTNRVHRSMRSTRPDGFSHTLPHSRSSETQAPVNPDHTAEQISQMEYEQEAQRAARRKEEMGWKPHAQNEAENQAWVDQSHVGDGAFYAATGTNEPGGPELYTDDHYEQFPKQYSQARAVVDEFGSTADPAYNRRSNKQDIRSRSHSQSKRVEDLRRRAARKSKEELQDVGFFSEPASAEMQFQESRSAELDPRLSMSERLELAGLGSVEIGDLFNLNEVYDPEVILRFEHALTLLQQDAYTNQRVSEVLQSVLSSVRKRDAATPDLPYAAERGLPGVDGMMKDEVYAKWFLRMVLTQSTLHSSIRPGSRPSRETLVRYLKDGLRYASSSIGNETDYQLSGPYYDIQRAVDSLILSRLESDHEVVLEDYPANRLTRYSDDYDAVA